MQKSDHVDRVEIGLFTANLGKFDKTTSLNTAMLFRRNEQAVYMLRMQRYISTDLIKESNVLSKVGFTFLKKVGTIFNKWTASNPCLVEHLMEVNTNRLVSI